MHILLFGGSFNPPHLGHAIVIEQSFELIPNLNELWILPTYNHTFSKELAPATNRLAMCQLLVDELQPTNHQDRIVKLCSFEIDHKSTGSTYQTLQSLKSLYPQHTFSFLMGSDQLPSFKQWDDYPQLLKEMPFFVYPRGSHRHNIDFPHMTLLESPTQVITNISSTLIRNRLSQHQSISRIMTPTIRKYIHDHHLYA